MSLFIDPFQFWFVAARIGGFAVALPPLAEYPVPRYARVALVVWLTVAIIPVTPSAVIPPSAGPADLMGAIAADTLVGTGLGLVVRIAFSAIQWGGTVIDSEAGLMAASQLNPSSPLSGSPISTLLLAVGILYFWVLDFMPLFLAALHRSFILVPPGSVAPWRIGARPLVEAAAGIFSGGLIIAAPVMALTFCINLALGFLARAVQGINIFFESFTMRLIVAVGGLFVFLPIVLLGVRIQLEAALGNGSSFLEEVARGALP